MKGPVTTAAAGMYEYIWAHGTTSVRILGALKLQKMMKSFPEHGVIPHGFYCMCCSLADAPWNSVLNVQKAWPLGKNTSNIVIGGSATHDTPQGKASRVQDEQQTCKEKGVAHRTGRWCIKPKLARITSLWMTEQKHIPTSPDSERDSAED